MRCARWLSIIALAAPAVCTSALAQSATDDAEALERGLASAKPEQRVDAIRSHGRSASAGVVKLLARSLRDRERAVRSEAVSALRFLRTKSALVALHTMLEKDRSLSDDPELLASVYKAIGEHGDPTSIPRLTKELLVQPDRNVVRAGILALGNIRDERSVAALFSLMRSAARGRVQRFMPELRLALVVLTGIDHGESQDRWVEWWNDNKRKLGVHPGLPLLTERDRSSWDAHWGRRQRQGRATKRHERGAGD